MALAKDIMGGGTSAMQAQAINGRANNAVSAAGTSQTDATELTASINNVSTVAASSGVRLYNGLIGDSQIVYNSGANTLKVYPPTSGAINQVAANTAVTLGQYTAMVFYKVTSTQWVGFLSA